MPLFDVNIYNIVCLSETLRNVRLRQLLHYAQLRFQYWCMCVLWDLASFDFVPLCIHFVVSSCATTSPNSLLSLLARRPYKLPINCRTASFKKSTPSGFAWI